MSQQRPPFPPYQIQAEDIPDRYPRGWFCLGLLDDFRPPADSPQNIDGFGGKVVVRCRGSQIDASLNGKRLPTLARNRLLLCWYDPDGNPPLAMQEPPIMGECNTRQWSRWQMREYRIHANCRELIDNMADAAHFGPVHGANVRSFRNVMDGHTFVQEMRGHSERLSAESELYSYAKYYGPAYQTTYMRGSYDGHTVESYLLLSHLPVARECFDIRYAVMVKRLPLLNEAQNAELCKMYAEKAFEAFAEDVAIWHNKTRIDNPILCDGDGPIHKLRTWYAQFYQPLAEINEERLRYREYQLRYD